MTGTKTITLDGVEYELVPANGTDANDLRLEHFDHQRDKLVVEVAHCPSNGAAFIEVNDEVGVFLTPEVCLEVADLLVLLAERHEGGEA